MKRIVSMVAVLALVTAVAPGASATASRATRYEIVTTKDVPVKMSDGTRLYVDVYRPGHDGKAVPGRFPVILTQTPYNKNSGALAFEAPFLIERGYVQVIADVRGTGASEGNWNSFGDREQKDGLELANWATSQPWSNGDLGLYGTSYGAINQLFTAAQHPEGLKAIFPIVPMADAYRDISGSGGQVNTSFIPLWLGLVTGLGLLPPTYTGGDPATAVQVLLSHITNIADFQANAVASATTGGDNAFDGPFYRTRSPIEVIDKVNVPTFISGGWFDLFQRGEPLLYQRLRANGTPVKLLMGPWYHTTAGGGLPQDGVPDLDELATMWFDHYMKGIPEPGLDKLNNVTYFSNGDGHYHHASDWPPPGTHYEELFLSGPALSADAGTLEKSAPGDQDADFIPWQPASGVCTRSTVQWTAGDGEGSFCETHNEVNDASGLSYDLKLDHDVNITGPISARLFVGTKGTDGLITARVEDVAPDGTATQLTAGWNVISLRALDRSKSEITQNGLVVRPYHPFTEESQLPVENGVVNEVYVEIFPTAALLQKGHSLRLSITPSDAPHLSAPLPQAVDSAGGVLWVFHDAKHPSSLIVPVGR
ncbi:MAG TPA: CocE/NonD family hydrolase [Actinomycetota bacterium]|nr:CocE/NonD family hydrolase [Actinomycetota bacterium]